MSIDNQYKYVLRKCFGNQYEPTQKYVFCIQGSSTSGKSTLANTIYNILQENKIVCEIINLDNYYKSSKLAPEETKTRLLKKENCYDFDNPAALDWDKVRNFFVQIQREDEYLDGYKYDYTTEICKGPYKILNKKPNVIILEGIYAFNCLSPKVFAIEEFDVYDSEKVIDNMFTKNEIDFSQYKIVNIRLTMCKSKSLAIRKERDVNLRGKSEEVCNMQFNTQTWPASVKWVSSLEFNDDIRILHGSFNESKIQSLVNAVSDYFCKTEQKKHRLMIENDTTKQFEVNCSGECYLKNN
ncbi:hypothetical protein BDAP_001611 [Binucleata daphniae]